MYLSLFTSWWRSLAYYKTGSFSGAALCETSKSSLTLLFVLRLLSVLSICCLLARFLFHTWQTLRLNDFCSARREILIPLCVCVWRTLKLGTIAINRKLYQSSGNNNNNIIIIIIIIILRLLFSIVPLHNNIAFTPDDAKRAGRRTFSDGCK